MPEVAEARQKFVPVTTEGKTITEVVRQIDRQLRGTELEPEWLNPANWVEDDNEAMFGPKSNVPGRYSVLAIGSPSTCSAGGRKAGPFLSIVLAMPAKPRTSRQLRRSF
ncbi:hypothetical protein SAMN05216345_111149 [Cupriavidus sp. YR651]|uniref:hypothetical protein n=1 Tax=Cupriavidus sp. YR651 TaxID=1855315 RepID=UPI0008927C29|nr:hypothetical protein [Cupriavidus sp. YR651]SDD58552.1 hypothetical protein SAMN05216345_111149 [Cupriavidus sp. YR651]